MSETSEDPLARAGIRVSGFVDSADKSNDTAPLDSEFKDTAVPIGDLTSEMVSELVAAFCRDTRFNVVRSVGIVRHI
jgi:hypothetical protein